MSDHSLEELEVLTYHPNFDTEVWKQNQVWNQASNQVHKKNQRQNSGHIFGSSVLLKHGTFPTDVASNGAFPHFATLSFGNQFRHLPVGMTLRWTPWFFLSLFGSRYVLRIRNFPYIPMTWWWDWDHQSYQKSGGVRAFFGFVGWKLAKSPRCVNKNWVPLEDSCAEDTLAKKWGSDTAKGMVFGKRLSSSTRV